MATTVKQDATKQLLINLVERLVDEVYAEKSTDSDVAFLRDNFKISLINLIRNTDLTSSEEITLPEPNPKEEVPQ